MGDRPLSSDITPRWLDLASAEKYTCMAKKTLKKRIEAGEIYGSLKGGKWFVDRESIDAFHLADKAQVEKIVERVLRSR